MGIFWISFLQNNRKPFSFETEIVKLNFQKKFKKFQFPPRVFVYVRANWKDTTFGVTPFQFLRTILHFKTNKE